MSCLLEELRIQMDAILLTVCTVPYNMKFDQHALEMNEKVRNLNRVIREIHRKSVLPVGLLDVAERMEQAGFPEDTSNDGIHFDRPRGAEWLNDVFQRHINALEADLLETAQFTLGPPPNPPFLASRALSGRLGPRVDTRDSSRSNQARLPSATPMESEEVTSSTPPGSAISSVVVAESKRVERPMETARLRYPEKVKGLDLEGLECRRELAETLGIERVSHEDSSRHHCVDWLKAHETHFSRAKLMETADLTGIPTKAIMGPINYRPLKLLGSPGLIAEPPKHRTSIARIRLATPAQLRVVDKLLNLGGMELPDAAPRKNLELPLASETSNMGMILLSSEEREKNTFEENRYMFLGSLKDDAWQEFLKEFNQEVGSETTLDKFKEELWGTVVKFGEPLLIGTGLDEKARKELLNKLIELRKSRSKTR